MWKVVVVVSAEADCCMQSTCESHTTVATQLVNPCRDLTKIIRFAIEGLSQLGG